VLAYQIAECLAPFKEQLQL